MRTRETKANIIWLDPDEAMEWARLDSSGTGRKQAMDAMASQGLRNAFSAKAFLVERFHRKEGIKPRVE